MKLKYLLDCYSVLYLIIIKIFGNFKNMAMKYKFCDYIETNMKTYRRIYTFVVQVLFS